MSGLAWLWDNYSVIITFLFALSEVLAMIPGIEASAVYQLVYGVLKALKRFVSAPPKE